MKKICASCIGINVSKIIKTNNESLPKWLQNIDYVEDFIQSKTTFKETHKKTASMKLELDVGIKYEGQYILYWGAAKSFSPIIKSAKDAYGNFKNNGISKVNTKGVATLYFDCPQPYSTTVKGKKKRESFYRHIHFCFSNKLKKKWLSTVYTKLIVCTLNLKKTLNIVRKGDAVLINSLPREYYGKSHIPCSYNLPHTELKRMSQKEVMEWMEDVVKINYKKLHKMLKNGSLNIYELPIIVYCAHSKCNSSHIAATELLKKGFVNISDYKGGMKKYIQSITS